MTPSGALESAGEARHRPPSTWLGREHPTTSDAHWHHCCETAGTPMSGPSRAQLLTEMEEFHSAGRKHFWISFSRSGQSPEGVALLERALERHRDIQHLVITCSPQGKTAELCAKHPDRATTLVLDD